MEHGNVPAPSEQVQELHQGARAFGKLEAKHALIRQRLSSTADHVANMQFGRLVIGHVDDLEVLAVELCKQFTTSPLRVADLDADEDLGTDSIVVAVVELGDIAFS